MKRKNSILKRVVTKQGISLLTLLFYLVFDLLFFPSQALALDFNPKPRFLEQSLYSRPATDIKLLQTAQKLGISLGEKLNWRSELRSEVLISQPFHHRLRDRDEEVEIPEGFLNENALVIAVHVPSRDAGQEYAYARAYVLGRIKHIANKQGELQVAFIGEFKPEEEWSIDVPYHSFFNLKNLPDLSRDLFQSIFLIRKNLTNGNYIIRRLVSSGPEIGDIVITSFPNPRSEMRSRNQAPKYELDSSIELKPISFEPKSQKTRRWFLSTAAISAFSLCGAGCMLRKDSQKPKRSKHQPPVLKKVYSQDLAGVKQAMRDTIQWFYDEKIGWKEEKEILAVFHRSINYSAPVDPKQAATSPLIARGTPVVNEDGVIIQHRINVPLALEILHGIQSLQSEDYFMKNFAGLILRQAFADWYLWTLRDENDEQNRLLQSIHRDIRGATQSGSFTRSGQVAAKVLPKYEKEIRRSAALSLSVPLYESGVYKSFLGELEKRGVYSEKRLEKVLILNQLDLHPRLMQINAENSRLLEATRQYPDQVANRILSVGWSNSVHRLASGGKPDAVGFSYRAYVDLAMMARLIEPKLYQKVLQNLRKGIHPPETFLFKATQALMPEIGRVMQEIQEKMREKAREQAIKRSKSTSRSEVRSFDVSAKAIHITAWGKESHKPYRDFINAPIHQKIVSDLEEIIPLIVTDRFEAMDIRSFLFYLASSIPVDFSSWKLTGQKIEFAFQGRKISFVPRGKLRVKVMKMLEEVAREEIDLNSLTYQALLIAKDRQHQAGLENIGENWSWLRLSTIEYLESIVSRARNREFINAPKAIQKKADDDAARGELETKDEVLRMDINKFDQDLRIAEAKVKAGLKLSKEEIETITIGSYIPIVNLLEEFKSEVLYSAVRDEFIDRIDELEKLFGAATELFNDIRRANSEGDEDEVDNISRSEVRNTKKKLDFLEPAPKRHPKVPWPARNEISFHHEIAFEIAAFPEGRARDEKATGSYFKLVKSNVRKKLYFLSAAGNKLINRVHPDDSESLLDPFDQVQSKQYHFIRDHLFGAFIDMWERNQFLPWMKARFDAGAKSVPRHVHMIFDYTDHFIYVQVNEFSFFRIPREDPLNVHVMFGPSISKPYRKVYWHEIKGLMVREVEQMIKGGSDLESANAVVHAQAVLALTVVALEELGLDISLSEYIQDPNVLKGVIKETPSHRSEVRNDDENEELDAKEDEIKKESDLDETPEQLLGTETEGGFVVVVDDEDADNVEAISPAGATQLGGYGTHALDVEEIRKAGEQIGKSDSGTDVTRLIPGAVAIPDGTPATIPLDIDDLQDDFPKSNYISTSLLDGLDPTYLPEIARDPKDSGFLEDGTYIPSNMRKQNFGSDTEDRLDFREVIRLLKPQFILFPAAILMTQFTGWIGYQKTFFFSILLVPMSRVFIDALSVWVDRDYPEGRFTRIAQRIWNYAFITVLFASFLGIANLFGFFLEAVMAVVVAMLAFTISYLVPSVNRLKAIIVGSAFVPAILLILIYRVIPLSKLGHRAKYGAGEDRAEAVRILDDELKYDPENPFLRRVFHKIFSSYPQVDARYLQGKKDTFAFDYLTWRLLNENPTVIRDTVKALGVLGDDRALPALEQMVAHVDEGVRVEAIRALLKFGNAGNISLYKQLEKFKHDDEIRKLIEREMDSARYRSEVRTSMRLAPLNPGLKTMQERENRRIQKMMDHIKLHNPEVKWDPLLWDDFVERTNVYASVLDIKEEQLENLPVPNISFTASKEDLFTELRIGDVIFVEPFYLKLMSSPDSRVVQLWEFREVIVNESDDSRTYTLPKKHFLMREDIKRDGGVIYGREDFGGHSGVSRQHFRLFYRDGRLTIETLSETKVTSVARAKRSELRSEFKSYPNRDPYIQGEIFDQILSDIRLLKDRSDHHQSFDEVHHTLTYLKGIPNGEPFGEIYESAAGRQLMVIIQGRVGQKDEAFLHSMNSVLKALVIRLLLALQYDAEQVRSNDARQDLKQMKQDFENDKEYRLLKEWSNHGGGELDVPEDVRNAHILLKAMIMQFDRLHKDLSRNSEFIEFQIEVLELNQWVEAKITEIQNRSELRRSAVEQLKDVRRILELRNPIVFSMSAHQLTQMPQDQYEELLGLKLIMGKQLSLIISDDDQSFSNRIQELMNNDSVYLSSQMIRAPERAITIHFNSMDDASFAGEHVHAQIKSRRPHYFDIYEGAFGTALLYAYHDGELPGLKKHKGFLYDPDNLYASQVIRLLSEHFAIVAVSQSA